MDNVILNTYSKISNLNVSRETCNEFEKYNFNDTRKK